MELTDHHALPAVLSVTGIGKTYAEPVLADVALSLFAGEAEGRFDEVVRDAAG